MDAREIYDEIAILDVQLACDVLRRVWEEADHGDGFVSLEVEPGLRARHRGDDQAGARVLGARRPPQPDDQDPGHRGRRAGDRGDDRGGDQRERDAPVLGGVVPRSPRPTSAAWSAATRQASRSTSTRWRASSSRAWTPRWTSAWRLGREDLRGIAAVANARAAYSASRTSSAASASRRCASGRARPAPAVGVDRGEGPALPGDEVRRVARRAGHGQHHADAHTARLRRAARGRPARPPTRTRRGPEPRSPMPASTWAT